jgi:hypothetical protein
VDRRRRAGKIRPIPRSPKTTRSASPTRSGRSRSARTRTTRPPLVDPGDPENSWLFHLLSRCEPTREGGGAASHMSLNAPFLLDDALVAKVRDWIADGAPNN